MIFQKIDGGKKENLLQNYKTIGEGFYEDYPPLPISAWILITFTVTILPICTINAGRRKRIKFKNFVS